MNWTWDVMFSVALQRDKVGHRAAWLLTSLVPNWQCEFGQNFSNPAILL